MANIMRMHAMSVLVCCLINISYASLPSNLMDKGEELRRKIGRMFNGKQKGNEMLRNIDEYEYPRTNDTLRQMHRQRWLDYYECLKGAYADAGRERIAYPSALVALEGTSVTLKCQICVSPAETRATDLIQWYYDGNSGKSDTSGARSALEDTEHTVRSPDSQYIVMYNLKSEQAGAYWCEMGDTVAPVYYLHVDRDFEAIDVVHPDTAVRAPQAAPARDVPEYDLRVYTTWTTWSPCSTCDVVGMRVRYGYCTVSLLETSEHEEGVVDEGASTIDESRYTKREAEELDEWKRTVEDHTVQTTAVNESIRIRLRTALSLFKNKLPCKSRFLPRQVRTVPAVKNRKTEIMRRYCKKKCRRNVIFEVRDEKGNVLESANNSAGIYSMIQGMPEPSPSVTRSVIYERHRRKIKLVCPGNLNADAPVVWRIGDKIISPFRIERQSNGRIRINPQMHIIFQSLRFEDANVYSCWQNNELAGIIKLNVTGEIELRLNHHVILIGAILIIGVFLTIFWRAFKGRTRYTIH